MVWGVFSRGSGGCLAARRSGLLSVVVVSDVYWCHLEGHMLSVVVVNDVYWCQLEGHRRLSG